MPRYWVIAPVESKPRELFDKVWQFDLTNNLISIGWKQLGDVSNMSREELSEAVASTYPDKPPQTKGLYANMIWAFYHEINPGDIIVARRGRKTLTAVGKVNGPAYYTPGKCPDHGHPHFMEVLWQSQPRDKDYHGIVFPMRTLAELTEQQFRSLVEGSGMPPITQEITGTTENASEFVLEKYLEDFIVSNFDAIFKKKYKIYEESEQINGQQYPTDIGTIDILAIEAESSAFVVIELKKGRPSDQVVGQTLRYMGWVKENLCTNGQAVKGLVICRDADPKLSYALAMTNNIDVRYYSVWFKLREAP
ncbi:MAG TPA: endonuclease NucS domain-containing protein [Thermoguttaceae bacterium]|nr:endonuclease NucS domain-containing protein [Thermoguttaceae bacterium]